MDGCGGYARKIKGTENECLRWKSTACIKAKRHACTTRLGVVSASSRQTTCGSRPSRGCGLDEQRERGISEWGQL